MGTRKRVGLIVPSADPTIEPDFALAAPAEVTIHADRIGWGAKSLDEDEAIVDRMNAGVEEAAEKLAAARVEVIAYGFSTGSFYRGPAYATGLVERIQRASGSPAVVPILAMVAGLRLFDVRKLSVASPYPDWNNQRLQAYLEGAGFQVLNVVGEPRAAAGGFPVMADQEPQDIVDFCTQMCHPQADALLCSCTLWRALEAAGELEQRLEIPVVTANQAIIWDTLKTLGVNDSIHGFGRLLENLAVQR